MRSQPRIRWINHRTPAFVAAAMDDGQKEEGIETFAGDKQCVSPDTVT